MKIARMTAALTTTARLMLLFTLGCTVTEEKIELWKGTKNGPKKLAAAAVDKDVPISLRAEAIIALSEISDRDDTNVWDLYIKSFEKMDKADAAKVIETAAAVLDEKVSEYQKGTVTKSQVSAKDALVVMFDFASGPSKEAVQKALIKWCTKDYNIRALAGKYNIRFIIKKIGAPGAEALIALLKLDEPTIEHVAKLIREAGNKAVHEKASKALAAQIKGNLSKIQKLHLISAAVIGGGPVGRLLPDIAQNPDVTPELRRYALRAYSDGLRKEAIAPSPEHVDILFGIAENTEHDQYQREEAYYVIAQASRKTDVDILKIKTLLKSRDSFFRAVGLQCLLRIDGKALLGDALLSLEKSRRVKDAEELDGIVEQVASDPTLLPTVRGLIKSGSAFTAGIAAAVLGEKGKKEDIKLLESLESDKRNLPKSFKHKKLQDAAKAAVDSIKQRG